MVEVGTSVSKIALAVLESHDLIYSTVLDLKVTSTWVLLYAKQPGIFHISNMKLNIALRVRLDEEQ